MAVVEARPALHLPVSGKGRLVVVWGTRPDALKLGPCVAELRRLGAPLSLICTGQHTTLLDGCPAVNDLTGGLSLGLVGHPDPLVYVNRATAALQDALEGVLGEAGPISAVVVQGDTGTALAGARAAKALNLPIAHVEAGLRSGSLDDPWPEEGFRREITTLADWHYAPTEHARQNLWREGVDDEDIRVTGNSVVSALQRYATTEHVPNPKPQILISLHRREFLAKGHFHILSTLDALFEVAAQNSHIQFIWLIHPSLRLAVGEFPGTEWPCPGNVTLSAPVGYAAGVELLRTSLGLITDSGGLTEEAATLGVPCVMLRHHTDRPEAFLAGVAQSSTPDPLGMTDAVSLILSRNDLPTRPTYRHWPPVQGLPKNREPSSCFGTPDAASKIARHLSSLT